MKKTPLALLMTSVLFLAQGDGDSGPKPPEVGQPAPSFRLNDHTGALQEVGGVSNEWTVVAFYPKAMTPG